MSEAAKVRRAMLEDAADEANITVRPQRRNANRHTARGMQALEKSIEQDGWIGAVTVAADGETFDGSARVEKTAENGMLDDPIVLDIDGTRPVILRRTDIPTASDPRAKRLGLAANRVASLNLEWEPDVLAELAKEVDVSALFYPDELAELAQPALPEAGAGGDEFDTTPDDGPTRAQLGDLWIIGGVHRLLVGDCTDPANVARLMGGERAAAVVTDPPYGVRDEEWDRPLTAADVASMLDASDGPVLCFGAARPDIMRGVLLIEPLAQRVMVWRQPRPAAGHGMFWTWQPIYCWRADFNGWDSLDWQDAATKTGDHPTQKPIGFCSKLIEMVSSAGDLLYEPFCGSGTTLIAAHRTGRRCYGMEISERYADVILRRAEAEGLTVEREP